MTTARDDESGGVHFGNVSGGISGSIFAGRDVKGATISLGGQPTSADKMPTMDEFQQLLAQIQQELAQITAQQETLKEISSATPFTAQGAEQNIKDAAEKVNPEMKPEEAKSVQQRLNESVTLLTTILDGAKTVANKAGDAAKAIAPLIEKLAPLITQIGVAALWAAKLWP